MSISLAAYIKGFMEYKEKSHIKGVIFNQMSPMLYPRMKKLVEEQLEVEVLGYVPKVEDCVIESRHLGLVLPEEISDLRERLQKLAGILEDTLEIDRILGLDKNAEELQVPESLIQKDRTISVSFRKWGQSWLISRQFMMNIFLQIWMGFFFMAVIRN